mgnify:CR=1 FL=1
MKQKNNYSRRNFIKITTASSIALALPSSALAIFENQDKPIKIGLIADLHNDVMHDGKERLSSFLKAMKQYRPDALVQLGDFAYPGDKNKEVIELFNNANKNTLHVIGNHDTDAGYTKQQCIDYWGMSGRYYVKKVNGISFIVLDGNDKGSPTYSGGYVSYIGEQQWMWLKEQLKIIDGPIIIVSHQPLAGAFAVDNAEEIQDILSTASDKILLCINGHTHIDSLVRIKNVSYLHINSASYQWVGGKYKHQSYSQEVHENFKFIDHTCPYKDSLFAEMTIDPITMTVKIEGRTSEWVGSSPAELGADQHPTLTNGEEIAAHIRNRNIEKVNKK